MKLNEEAHRRLVLALSSRGWGEGDVDAMLTATWRQYGRELSSPGIDADAEGRRVLVGLARAMAKARAFKGRGPYGIAKDRVLEFIPRGALEMLSDYEGAARDLTVQTMIVRGWRRGWTGTGAKKTEPTIEMMALALLTLSVVAADVDDDTFVEELERAADQVKKAARRDTSTR